MQTTNYAEKAERARKDAAAKRRWARQALDIAAHRDCSREDREKHRAYAAELERAAEVDDAFAETCTRWATEAA